MKATDIMTPHPVVVGPDTPLRICARLLLDKRVRQLPVVNHTGHVLGLIGDTNLFRKGALVGLDQDEWMPFDFGAGTTAEDVMTDAPIVVGPEEPALRVLAAILEEDPPVALIVGERLLVGVVTEHDAMRLASMWVPQHISLDESTSHPVFTVHAETPASEAWGRMRESNIRHLIVVDDLEVVNGVVSRQDLALRYRGGKVHQRVADVKRSDTVQAVPPGAGLQEAAATMHRQHIGCLPVVDPEGHAIGILTRRDVLRTLVVLLEQQAERLLD